MNIMGNYFFRQLILWFKKHKVLSERLGLTENILTYAMLLIPITVFMPAILVIPVQT